MVAFVHCVGIASFWHICFESSRNYTCVLEEIVGRPNLSSIAGVRESTGNSFATSGCVSGWQKEGFSAQNAVSVIESFGCSKCPARTAVGLIPDFSNVSALWPLIPWVKVSWRCSRSSLSVMIWRKHFNPVGVNNRSKSFPNFRGFCAIEFTISPSFPRDLSLVVKLVDFMDDLVLVDLEINKRVIAVLNITQFLNTFPFNHVLKIILMILN